MPEHRAQSLAPLPPAGSPSPPSTSEQRIAAAAASALALYGGDVALAAPWYGLPDPSGESARALACGAVLAPPVRPLPSRSGNLEADFEAMVRSVQDEICAAVEALEGARGARFREDNWARAEGGGGRSRVLQEGRVFSKAGVNVSTVHGVLPPAAVV